MRPELHKSVSLHCVAWELFENAKEHPTALSLGQKGSNKTLPGLIETRWRTQSLQRRVSFIHRRSLFAFWRIVDNKSGSTLFHRGSSCQSTMRSSRNESPKQRLINNSTQVLFLLPKAVQRVQLRSLRSCKILGFLQLVLKRRFLKVSSFSVYLRSVLPPKNVLFVTEKTAN